MYRLYFLEVYQYRLSLPKGGDKKTNDIKQ